MLRVLSRIRMICWSTMLLRMVHAAKQTCSAPITGPAASHNASMACCKTRARAGCTPFRSKAHSFRSTPCLLGAIRQS